MAWTLTVKKAPSWVKIDPMLESLRRSTLPSGRRSPATFRRQLSLAAVAVVSVSLSACSLGADDDAAAPSSTVMTTSAAPSAAPTTSSTTTVPSSTVTSSSTAASTSSAALSAEPAPTSSAAVAQPAEPGTEATVSDLPESVASAYATFSSLAPLELFAQFDSCDPSGPQESYNCSGAEVGQFQFIKSESKASQTTQVLTELRSSRVVVDSGDRIVGWSALGSTAVLAVVDNSRGLVLQHMISTDQIDPKQRLEELGLLA